MTKCKYLDKRYSASIQSNSNFQQISVAVWKKSTHALFTPDKGYPEKRDDIQTLRARAPRSSRGIAYITERGPSFIFDLGAAARRDAHSARAANPAHPPYSNLARALCICMPRRRRRYTSRPRELSRKPLSASTWETGLCLCLGKDGLGDFLSFRRKGCGWRWWGKSSWDWAEAFLGLVLNVADSHANGVIMIVEWRIA